TQELAPLLSGAKWKDSRGRRGLNARQTRDARQQLIRKGETTWIARIIHGQWHWIFRIRKRHAHRDYVARVEADIDLAQLDERAQHQSGADQQHERECHFRGDQHTAHASLFTSSETWSTTFVHRIAQVRARGL